MEGEDRTRRLHAAGKGGRREEGSGKGEGLGMSLFRCAYHIWSKFRRQLLLPILYTFVCRLAVQIFGNDVRDVSVNEDLLIVVHASKTYRFYSLEWIMKNCTVVEPRLGATVTVAGHVGDVGSTGFGIPVTVDLTGKITREY